MNLEEIKARTETAREEGFGLQQFDDLDSLIAEVERLTAEIEEWKAQGMSFEQYKAFTEIHRKYPSPQYSIIESFEKENAALKKALEYMHADMEETAGIPIPDVEEYIHQAQEQERQK